MRQRVSRTEWLMIVTISSQPLESLQRCLRGFMYIEVFGTVEHKICILSLRNLSLISINVTLNSCILRRIILFKY